MAQQDEERRAGERRLQLAIDKGELKFPGFKWRERAAGRAPYWFPDEALVKAGYPVKSSNLTPFLGEPTMVSQRCLRLQAEATAWKAGRAQLPNAVPEYDGTFETLIDIYLNDPESPYNVSLKENSRKLYGHYAAKVKAHIGELRIDESDGRDVNRWFAVWADREDKNNPRSPYRKLSGGRVALAVLMSAVSFGIVCRREGCVEFQKILRELEFPTLKGRTQAPTREQMEAACKAAIEAGAPSRALTYSLQFDTTGRQTDFIGEWVALSDPRPSAIIDRGLKWIGPTWAQVDDELILRFTHGKTDNTTEARAVYDLNICPMVMDRLQHIPVEQRKGPLIVNEETGLPYLYRHFREGWHLDYAAAGIPKGIWNRDTRAGGNTEGQRKGALLEDRKKVMGHTATSRVTAQVYDRDVLEAQRRVMKKRTGDGD